MNTSRRLTLSRHSALAILVGLSLSLSACQTWHQTNQASPNLSTHKPDHGITAAKTHLRLFQNIHEHTLDNGLKIIIKEDRRAPVVMTQIWYHVGANDEPMGKGGLSHFVEHLMFKDTPKVSGDEFSRLISHYGGSANAYTNSNVTVYHESLPANRYELALELEADRMKNILFKPDQIESERQVIQEERRSRTDDNPQAKAFERLLAFIYGDTPRGRPVIGSMADIHSLSMEDLQTWYATWYVPNNATLIIVGDVNKDDVLRHAQKYFGSITKGNTPPTRNLADFIHPDDVFMGKGGVSERHLVIEEAVQTPSIVLTWQIPSLSSLRLGGHFNEETHRELLALGLFGDVLSGGSSSRFSKNLIKKELVSSVAAYAQQSAYGDSLFTVSITPKAGADLDATKELVLDEIKRTMTDPIAQTEVDRSLIALKTGLIFVSDGVSGQAQIIGQQNHQNISVDDVQRELDLLPTISFDEIQNAGKRYLTDDRMYTAYILPKDDE